MRRSTRRRFRSVHGLSETQATALAAASDEAKQWAAQLLSAKPEDAPSEAGDPNAWADSKHAEGARIGAILASGTLEPGYPKVTDPGPPPSFVWTSPTIGTDPEHPLTPSSPIPPYRPTQEEIDMFASDWESSLGDFVVKAATGSTGSTGVEADALNTDEAKKFWKKEVENAEKALDPLAKYTRWLPAAAGAAGTLVLRVAFPVLPQLVSLLPLVAGLGVQVKQEIAKKAEAPQ